ncbi:Helix-turn-helix domain-containing protein (plasmid) [Rhodovastum atsumiense]|uniref:Helix-turn-helix domain-containing protein n=1 Tax=Rhodovastum atsumiense TaxID=504468 RepID=A0A5M6IU62_9PROT|nr:helix-turn-helix domain-containing protein [Rhodovastum atsumiense]KAA5611814.1 helix-turn-helix domain-containing protein [Rhodovastum atsumiense]CAH2606077.1 Helix-turn-helix domain-containing protein [Rhodovastum atsumiense]
MATGEMDGQGLREARIRSGLPVREWARRLGVGKSSIGRWETGQLPVPRKIALAVVGLQAELAAARNAEGGRV